MKITYKLNNFLKLSLIVKKTKGIMNNEIVNIKGWKSIGNKLDTKLRMSGFEFKAIELSISGFYISEVRSYDFQSSES